MGRLYPIWKFIGHNKYWIVIVVCVCVVGFLDENSMLQHARNQMVIRDLKAQIEEYNSRYERDEARLKELKRDPNAITKIARENYFMKADDEDIFVLSDDQNNVKSNETAD